MTPNIPNRVIAGFLSLSLGLFSVPVMPAALADGLVPVAVKDPQQEKSVTSDYSEKTQASQNTNSPADMHTSSLDDNPLSVSEAPAPATRPFSAKAAVSPDGKDVLSVEVKEGGKAFVTLTQYGQKQSYEGKFDEASQSIRIDNVKNGYSWNVSFEKSGSQVALKRFDIILNQTGYNYEQRFGFSGQRLSYREYASSSTMYGSYDSLYRQAYVTDAAGRTLEHTLSVNKSTYSPSMYGSADASNSSLTVAGGTPGKPVTQYSIWTDISSVDANGKPVKTAISLYGGDEEIQGIKDLYLELRETIESGNIDYETVGKTLENHPGVFMKTAGTHSGFPAAWNNLLHTVEYVRGSDGNFEARLVRNKNDYQNVDIVVSSEGGITPDKWKKLRFKNWQSVAVEGRNYSVSYGMTYSNKNTASGSGMITANGRLGKPVYGLSFSSWFQDPVSKSWMQDQVIIENFPENRRAVIGGKEYDIELNAQGIITLKIVPQTNPALEALRLKIAAMIETAAADIARFEGAADSKIHQAEEMARVMNPLAGEVSGIFSGISAFENIPGMEALKGEAQKIHASAQQGITGVEGIVSYLKGDAGLDQLDIESLQGFIAKLQKISESLVPGTDPAAVKLPDAPQLVERPQFRPSVNFEEVIAALKGSIVSLNGLLEKAEALRTAHRAEVERAVTFAKSLFLNADGNINLDLNGDGVVNDADRVKAGEGYAHALKYLDYLHQQVIALLDLNRDGLVNVQDRDYLLKKIASAFELPALRAKIAAMISAAMEEIQAFEKAAALKTGQVNEMASVMSSLTKDENALFLALEAFENIPGLEELKAQAIDIHADAAGAAAGAEFIMNWMKHDAGLDLKDASLLKAYVESLKKIAAGLENGGDPSNTVLPERPKLSTREQIRPSVSFEAAVEIVKDAIASLNSLLEKAEALRAAHKKELERAADFAKSLFLNAVGNLNLDLNGDGVINETDRVKAGEGYAHALKYVVYLPQQVSALLDLNRDGLVNVQDRDYLLKKISDALALPALRAKIAAMIEAASADVARFEEAADSKIQQVEEMASVMNPLADKVRGIINVISAFENIPGMDILKAEAHKIFGSVQQGITGVEGIMNFLTADEGFDRQDIASLRDYILELKKIEESLVPGTDPAGVKLPDAPQLVERPQFRPSVNFEEVIVALKGTVVSLNGLLDKAEALRNAHRAELERAVTFAKSLFLNADGNINLDLNGDGVVNDADRVKAGEGYAHALNYLEYLPQQVIALLDLNRDGRVNDTDRVLLQKKIEIAMDKEGPVIANVIYPPLTRESKAAVNYTVDGVAMEQIVELLNEGDNRFVLTAQDEAGNVTEFPVLIVRDTMAPEIRIVSDIPDVINALELNVVYTVDGEKHERLFQLTPGKNELRLEAKDKAGNKSEFVFSILMDNTAPVIRVSSVIPALTNQKYLVVEYFVESGNGEGGQAQRAEFNLSEGVNALKIEAVDAAGNIGVYEFKTTLDTIAPKISGVEHVSLTNQTIALVKYFVEGVLTQREFSLVHEGENILAIKARDEAGNEAAHEVRIVRDTVAPKIELTSEIPEATSSSTLKVLYKVDGGSEMEKTFYLVEGINEIVVKHTDQAGNAGLSEIRQITYRPEAPQNQKPAANAASFKVNQNGELTGFVTGSDEDGDSLSYEVAIQPEHGTLEINSSTGAFVYKPDAGYNGSDAFSFRVNDGKEYSDDARVALQVTPAGSAPVFEAIADVAVLPNESLSAKVSVTLKAVDPEGGAVTFSIKEILKDGKKVSMPERMLLTVDGKLDWAPEPAHAGRYVITFEALDIEGFSAQRQMTLDVKTPSICIGNSEVCNFLRTQYGQGLAAGNVGDYYHNRDGFHTNFNVSALPQLSRMNSGWAAEYATYPDRVIIGNSSTSGGQPGTSNPASLEQSYGALATYNQHRGNALYMYPEHIDHDAVDNFISNNTYLKVSQGSSGSEMDEVNKYLYTLAAFRPEVKAKLKERGLLMSTLEMIFRLTRVGSDEDRYLTGEAHPRAFNDSNNLMAMVRMANAMTLEDIPAFAQIKVVEDDYETGGNFDNKTEKHYDTPAAISRVHRGLEYTKTMIVDVGGSLDVNGHELKFKWRVLRGDQDHVRISKIGEGTLWKIEIDYHNEATAEGSSLDSTVLSNRVDIGLFIHNGHTWSSPAFISSSTLRNEERDYDENGVLKEIRYNANAMSSQFGFAKGWVKDVFNANGGWTRTMADGKTIDFTAEGHQIISKDGLGRVLTAKEVTYAYNSSTRKIGFTAGGSLAYYEYANDADLQGRLSKLEVTTSLGAVYVGRMIYGSDGQLTGVSVETRTGEALSQLAFGAGGAVSLSSADGSMTLKLGGTRTLGQLIDLAGSSAAFIPIMIKAAELMASEAGVSAADFELRNASVSASPQSAPYEGYMGNLTMLFHNLRQAKDSWAYSWTQRDYPLDLYPQYPSQQGFHIAVAGANQAYTYHDFSMAGVFMGKHAADYEIKTKMRNLTAFQFEKDSGLDADAYTFSVSSFNGDGAEGNFAIGYRIAVHAKDGTVVSTYKVNIRTYSIGNSSGGGGTVGGGNKNGTMYVIQDTSKALDLFGYILVNGSYILAWESHNGVETCHMTDVCSGLR